MKRLLAFLALLLPLYLFAQGFGSFSHDQPYLAKDRINENACVEASVTNVAGLVAWYKANALVYVDNGITLAVGDQTVYTWKDSSTNGNDLVQTTAGVRPFFKTNVINGLPIIGFTNKYIDRTYSSALVHPTTHFIVYQINTGIADPGFIHDGVGASYSDGIIRSGSSIIYNTGNAGGNGTIRPATLNTWFFDTVWYNGANSTCWTNGIQSVTNSIASLPNPTAIRLGATRFPDQYGTFRIAELIIYNSYVSYSNASNICCYLKNKYGL